MAAPTSGATASPPLVTHWRMADIMTRRSFGTSSNSSVAAAVADDRAMAPDSPAATQMGARLWNSVSENVNRPCVPVDTTMVHRGPSRSASTPPPNVPAIAPTE